MRSIPDPGFSGDDGSAAPEVTAALAAYEEDPSRYVDVLGALQGHRLLVPVVALLGEVERGEDGLDREKTSDMATVSLRGRDGRLALLAFTCTRTMQAWDPGARPVPASLRRVAAAALQDRASAIVIDVAGPARFVIEERDVRAIAEGFSLVRVPDGLAWAKVAGA